MRLCEKNKVDIWYSTDKIDIEETDSNGFFTGNIITTYQNIKHIKINLFPVSGIISNKIFGKDCDFDMMACSITDVFKPNTVLFLAPPSDTSNYDYIVSKINKSLNFYQYGLMRCVK